VASHPGSKPQGVLRIYVDIINTNRPHVKNYLAFFKSNIHVALKTCNSQHTSNSTNPTNTNIAPAISWGPARQACHPGPGSSDPGGKPG